MTKIFESPDKGETVYSREAGADPATRVEIGRDYDSRTSDGRPLWEHMQESQLWGNIHRAAKTNPALQIALDRVKVIYALTKDYEERYGHRKT
jgi:hypothetical protein